MNQRATEYDLNDAQFEQLMDRYIMTTIDFKKVTRLDLEIWDTQNKIKYIKLPTRHARKSELILSQTKGVRTNTNRGKINSKMASII